MKRFWAAMKTQPTLFWVGLVIYLSSFVVPAVEGVVLMDGPLWGFYCAFWSLATGAGEITSWLRGNGTIIGATSAFALFGSRMINVFFITGTVMTIWPEPRRIAGPIFKYLSILLYPSCWIFFYRMAIHPVLGYFLWTVGMLLMVFTSAPAVKVDPIVP